MLVLTLVVGFVDGLALGYLVLSFEVLGGESLVWAKQTYPLIW